MKSQLRLILGLTLAGHLAAGPVRAEPNFNTGTPPPLDTTPTYAPPPAAPQQDRKDGNGAAIAMAAVGAALSGASCAMLFAEANKAEQAGESSHAAMLRGQAMQQCAQAAQNMASALQNNKGKDAMTQQDNPGQPKFAELPQPEKAKTTESASNGSLSSGESKSAPGTEQTVDPVAFKGVDERAFDAPAAQGTGPVADIGPGIGNGVKTLEPIDRASVSFDDKSKGEGTTPRTPLGASSAAVGAGALPSSNNLKNLGSADLENGPDGKAPKGQRLRFSSGGEGGGGGSHPEGQPSSGSNFDLTSFMTQLQGAGAAKAPGAAADAASQITAIGRKDEGPAITIFQFASFRYRKAWKDDGLIGHLKRELVAKAPVKAAPVKAKAGAVKAPPAVKPTAQVDLKKTKAVVARK